MAAAIPTKAQYVLTVFIIFLCFLPVIQNEFWLDVQATIYLSNARLFFIFGLFIDSAGGNLRSELWSFSLIGWP